MDSILLGRCRNVEEFEKINRIGEGTYGTVYRAIDTSNGNVVALKRVLLHHEDSTGFPLTSLRELKLLQRITHENCIRLLDVAVGGKRSSVFLVFEYCTHDLASLLDHAPSPPFSLGELKRIMLDILHAIDYLHSNYIMHRDLKLSNLLYNQYGQMKMADFGLAREFGTPVRHGMTNKVVTLWYRAPELLLGVEDYTTAIDMWACGCIFGELLVNAPLMPGRSEVEQLHCMFQLLGQPNEEIWPDMHTCPNVKMFDMKACGSRYNHLAKKIPKHVSQTGLDLLNRLLCYDPSQRMTASEALKHPFFNEKPYPKDECLMPTFPSRHDLMKTQQKKKARQSFGERF